MSIFLFMTAIAAAIGEAFVCECFYLLTFVRNIPGLPIPRVPWVIP